MITCMQCGDKYTRVVNGWPICDWIMCERWAREGYKRETTGEKPAFAMEAGAGKG